MTTNIYADLSHPPEYQQQSFQSQLQSPQPSTATTSTTIGSRKRFECYVVGEPRPAVRWYKDGVNITSLPRYKFEYAPDGCVVLVLENVNQNDQGVYECRADNTVGSATTSALLSVTEKPLTSVEETDEETTFEMSYRRTSDRGLSSYSGRRSLSSETSGRSSYSSLSLNYQEQGISSSSKYSKSYASSSLSSTRSDEEHASSSFSSSRTSLSGKYSTHAGIEKVEQFVGEQLLELDSALSTQVEELTALSGDLRQAAKTGYTTKTSEMTYSENSSFAGAGCEYEIEQRSNGPRGKMQREEEHPGELDHQIADDPKARELAGKYLVYDASLLDSEGRGETAHEFHFMHKAESLTDGARRAVGSEPMQTVLKSVSESYESVEIKKSSKQKTASQFADATDGGVEIAFIEETKMQSNVSEMSNAQEKITSLEHEAEEIAEVVEERVMKAAEVKKVHARSEAVTESVVEEMAEEAVTEAIDEKTALALEETLATQESAAVEEVIVAESKQQVEIVYVGSDVSVMEGEAFELMWQIKGVSKSEIRVLKSNHEVTNNNHIKIQITDAFCVVTVKSATDADAGDYVIQVIATRNVYGKANVKVKIPKAAKAEPKFIPLQDSDITVNKGDHFDLRWMFTGVQKDDINVYRNGKKISPDDLLQVKFTEDICTISVSTATTDDAGVYVIKSGSNTNIDDVIKVKVISARDDAKLVDIKALISEVEVPTGERLTLKWQISELEKTKSTIKIFKDGEELFLDARCNLKFIDDICQLTIDNVNNDDIGNYTIKEDNSSQPVAPVAVRVISPATNICVIAESSDIFIKAGEVLVMKWKISGVDDLSKSISVLKNGVKLTSDKRLRYRVDGDVCALMAKGATSNDAGVYSISFAEDDVTYGAVNVKVVTSQVIQEQSIVSVTVGERLVMKWIVPDLNTNTDALKILKDNNELSPDDRHTLTLDGNTCVLTIDPSSPDDKGQYSVKIDNSSEPQAPVHATVVAPEVKVEVLTDSSNIDVKEGDMLVIKWKISGVTSITENLIIKKNGETLQSNKRLRYRVDGDVCTLMAKNALVDDTGMYSISFNTVDGEFGATNVNVVTSKPYVTADVNEVSAEEGMQLVMKWTVKDLENKKDKISVLKDGTELPKDERHKISFDGDICMLTISCSAEVDQGKYTLKIEEVDVPEAIIDAKVVAVPIHVTVDNTEVRLQEGDVLVLKWIISGVKNLSEKLVVRKNAVTLTSDKRLRYRVDGGVCTLMAKSALADDAGIYSVTISDVDGEYGVTDVNVLVPKIEVVTDESTISTKEGETLTVKWKYSDIIEPEKNVFVYTNGTKVDPGDRKTIMFSDDGCKLTITPAAAIDQATYSLSVGKNVTDAGAVDVKVTSSINVTSETSFVATDNGADFTIKWNIKGLSASASKATVKKNCTEVHNDATHDVTIDGDVIVLNVKAACVNDKGTYTIDVEEVVTDAAGVTVDVAEPKVEILGEPNVSVALGDNVAIRWKITGCANLSERIQIKKNGSKITQDKRLRYRVDGDVCTFAVKGIEAGDESSYSVTLADTTLDEGKVDVKVVVPTVAVIGDYDKAKINEGEDLMIKWKLSGVTDPSKIHVYKDGTEVAADDTHELTIKNDTCEYRVSHALESDKGKYDIRIDNVPEEVTAAGKVEADVVKPTAEPLMEGSKISVNEGDELTLKWRVTGVSDKSRIHVQKDGQDVIPDDKHTVNILDDVCMLNAIDVKVSDKGEYGIHFDGCDGDVGKVYVTVGKPSIEALLEGSTVSVKEGENIVLRWKISGTKNIHKKIHILKDGASVEQTKRLNFRMDGDVLTLMVKCASSNDVAKYAISIDGVDATFGEVGVDVVTPQIEVLQSKISVKEGKSFELSWKITDVADIKDKFAVLKDGIKVEADERHKYVIEGYICTCYVTSSKLSDTASYTVSVDGKQIEKSNVGVKVTAIPKVDVLMTGPALTVNEGDNITLKWKISGVEDIKTGVQIYKNGKQCPQDNRLKYKFDGDTCMLLAKSADPKDAGEYSVFINETNQELGQVDIKVIKKKQEAVPEKTKVYVKEGDEFRLKWNISGMDTKVDDVCLYKDGKRIVDTDGLRDVQIRKESCCLHSAKAKLRDEGTYAIYVNGLCLDSSKVTVQVEEMVLEAESLYEQLDHIDTLLKRKAETATETIVEKHKPLSKEKKTIRTVHGRLKREEEHPGLLDHALLDDPEARLMAGKFLFFEATIDEHGFDKHETAHEFHYLREAGDDYEGKEDESEYEAVMKSTAETTESIIIRRGIDSTKSTMSDNESVTVVGSKMEKVQKVQQIISSTSEIVSEDYVDGGVQEILTAEKKADVQNASRKAEKIKVKQTEQTAAETVEGDKSEILHEISSQDTANAHEASEEIVEESMIKAKVHDKKQAAPVPSDRPNLATAEETTEQEAEPADKEDKIRKTQEIKNKTTERVEIKSLGGDITVTEGDTVEMKWSIKGIKDTGMIRIFKGQKNVTFEKRIKIAFSLDIFTVTISSAILKDAATYSVGLENSEVIYGPRNVKVVEPHVEALTTDQEATAVVDNPLELRWKITGVTNMDKKVQVLKDGKAVKLGDGWTLSFEGDICSIKIHSVQSNDEGTYSLRIEDIHFKAAKVDVTIGPKETKANIIAINDNLSVDEGERLNVKWKVTATSEIVKSLRIFKNGEECTSSDGREITINAGILSYSVFSANTSDAATYSVRIGKSSIGNGKVNVNVNAKKAKGVSEAPCEIAPGIKVSVDCAEVTIEEGETMVLRWIITGVTDLMKKLTVKKNGETLKSEKRLRYRIDGDICTLMAKSALAEDTGVYSLCFSDVDGEFGKTNVNVLVPKAEVTTDESTASKKDDKKLYFEADVATEASKVRSKETEVTEDVKATEALGIKVTSDCTEVSLEEGKTLVLRWTISGVADLFNQLLVKKNGDTLTSDKRLRYRVDGDVCMLMTKNVLADDTGVYYVNFSGIDGEFGKTNVNVVVQKADVTTDDHAASAIVDQKPVPVTGTTREESKLASEVTEMTAAPKIAEASDIQVTIDGTEINIEEGQTLVLRWTVFGITDLSKKLVVKKNGETLTSEKRLRYRVDGDVCTLMAKSGIVNDTGVYTISFTDVDGQFGKTSVNVNAQTTQVSTDEYTSANEKSITYDNATVDSTAKSEKLVSESGTSSKLSTEENQSELSSDIMTEESGSHREQSAVEKTSTEGMTQGIKVTVDCKEVNIEEGKVLVLRWTITGVSELSKKINLKKNGEEISPSTRLRHRVDGNVCTLMVKRALAEDTGVYSLCFANVDGDFGATSVIVSVGHIADTPTSKEIEPTSAAKVSTEESSSERDDAMVTVGEVSLDDKAVSSQISDSIIGAKKAKIVTVASTESSETSKAEVQSYVSESLQSVTDVSHESVTDTSKLSVDKEEMPCEETIIEARKIQPKENAVPLEPKKTSTVENETPVKIEETNFDTDKVKSKAKDIPTETQKAGKEETPDEVDETLLGSKKGKPKDKDLTSKFDELSSEANDDIIKVTEIPEVGESPIERNGVQLTSKEEPKDTTLEETREKDTETSLEATEEKAPASGINVTIDCSEVTIEEGNTLVLRWKIEGNKRYDCLVSDYIDIGLTDISKKLEVKKNGEKLASNKHLRYRVDGDMCTLMTKSAISDDSGIYSVSFTDADGEFGTTNVKVIVPKIKITPAEPELSGEEKAVGEGTDVPIHTDREEVEDKKEPLQQMEEPNDAKIKEQGAKDNLEDSKTSSEETIMSKVKTDLSLRVNVTIDCSDVSIEEGNTLVLRWNISGPTDMFKKLEVKKNGETLTSNKRLRYRVDNDICTLMTKNAIGEDSGIYSVCFTGVEGEFGTTNVKVIVPEIKITPAEPEKSEEDKAVRMETTDKEASGDITDSAAQTINLQVEGEGGALKVTVDCTEVNLTEGQTLVLRWTVSGVTDVTKRLTLRKNGETLVSNKRLRYRVDGDICTLMAKSALTDDTGVYSISFSGIDGVFGVTGVTVVAQRADVSTEETLSSKSEEDLVPSVRASTESSTVSVSEGDDLKLTWTVSDKSKETLTVLKDGASAPEDGRTSTIIKDESVTYGILSATTDDTGTYSIKLGTSEDQHSTIKLTVLADSSQAESEAAVGNSVDEKSNIVVVDETEKILKGEVVSDDVIVPEKKHNGESDVGVDVDAKVDNQKDEVAAKQDIGQETTETSKDAEKEKCDFDENNESKRSKADKTAEEKSDEIEPQTKALTEDDNVPIITEESVSKRDTTKNQSLPKLTAKNDETVHSESYNEVQEELLIQTKTQKKESQIDAKFKNAQKEKTIDSVAMSKDASVESESIAQNDETAASLAITEEPQKDIKQETPLDTQADVSKPYKKKPDTDREAVAEEPIVKTKKDKQQPPQPALKSNEKSKSDELTVEKLTLDPLSESPKQALVPEENETFDRKSTEALSKDDCIDDFTKKKSDKSPEEDSDVKKSKPEGRKIAQQINTDSSKEDNEVVSTKKNELNKTAPKQQDESSKKVTEDQTAKKPMSKRTDDINMDEDLLNEKTDKQSKASAKQTPDEKSKKAEEDASMSQPKTKRPGDTMADSEALKKPCEPNQVAELERQESLHPKIDLLLNSQLVLAHEGDPFEILWKVQDIQGAEIHVCKDGLEVSMNEHLKLSVENNVCSLVVIAAAIDDEATYSIRQADSSYDEAQVTVRVASPRASETATIEAEKPTFVKPPSLEVESGRRLSIKCSVKGVPEPEVSWFHHGEQLGRDALWEVYTQEGYHCLEVNNPATLDCEQIVCRVENEAGFIQKAILLKREGREVYIDPILPPLTPEVDAELQPLPPRIELEVSETKAENLRVLTVAQDFRDVINNISLSRGDHVQVLSTHVLGAVLARHAELSSKVCYVSREILTSGDDVTSQEFQNSEDLSSKLEGKQQRQDISKDQEQIATMPERRKLKSPSPQMTSTPKMKRKGAGRESPMEDVKSRLGLKDTDVSMEPVDISDYDDGTTRPMFTKRLRNVTADSGQIAQLECIVSGTPLPRVLWLKNSRPLKSSDGCKVIAEEGKNTLVFPNANDDDVGTYTARAMNINGSAMSTAEFTLTSGKSLPPLPMTEDMDFTTPAYFFQMSSCEVAEGRLARFDCRVVAYPKPEIVWMRDGKVIETADRFKLLNFNNEIYSLLIQDVKQEDTGRYTCWARNKFGEAMTEAYLNVIAYTEEKEDGDIAPKFLTRFYDQQITEGTPMDFKCLIAGRPEPTVTWLLDEIELRDTPGLRMRHKDGMVSLEMKSPKMNQSGNYTCHIKNALGEATCSAKLTVIEDKLHGRMLPKFLKKFDHLAVKENEEVKISCVIVGEPKPAVSWMFDHKPILDSNRRYVMKQDGDVYTLTIKNARFDDVGTITCKAVNSEGEVYCSANLHVRESKFLTETPERRSSVDEVDSRYGYSPTFTKRLQDVQAKEGTKVKFECRFMGIPEPEVTWMKDGRVITDGGSYTLTREGDSCRLEVERVTSSDTGVYTCIVSNSKGKSSTTAGLKLETEKKEAFVPERPKSADRTYRKERYTPEKKAITDEPRSYRKSFVDTIDRVEAKPRQRRRSYESPVKSRHDDISSSYVNTSFGSPKRSFESPSRRTTGHPNRYSLDLDSSIRDYSTYDLDTTDYSGSSYRRDYSIFDSRDYSFASLNSSGAFDSPRKDFSSTRVESPRRDYTTGRNFESPRRDYTASSFETPKRDYTARSYTASSFETPRRDYTTRSLERDYAGSRLESPRREYGGSRLETPPPQIPKIPFDRPSVLNKREDSVRLSWLPAQTSNLPPDARMISYVVESRELPSREWTKVATSVPSTTYTVRHLRPDKEYEFRVRASNNHGISEPTCVASVEKRLDESRRFGDLPEMKAPPRLPTHRPIITDLGEETVRLAWRPAETYQAKRAPPVSYRLEAKELPDKDWMPLSSRLRDTSHYLSELPVDRDFMIRVRAENDFGVSEPTDALWLPRARAFPGVPVSRPRIVEIEANRAKLSWDRVDIPAFGLEDAPLLYMIEVQEPREEWRPVARDLTDTSYIIEGLKPDLDYRFRVRAKSPTGIISEPSPIASLYTTLARSRAPVDRLEVVDYEPETRSVQLSWQRVEIPPYDRDDEPLMYMLEYQEPPLPDWKPLVTGIPTTRYRVMHLDPERDYNFRVRALTSYGISAPSPALPVALNRPPVPKPKTQFVRPLLEPVTISDVEPDSLRLSWRRPMYDLSMPITYQVEMLEPPNRDWTPLATGYTDTTYKVTGLRPTKDYQFRVVPHVDSRFLDPTPIAAVTSLPVRPRLPMFTPTLKETTPESVQLSWRPAELPAYQRTRIPVFYRIEMQEVLSNTWKPVARRIPETTYTVTGLRPDSDYRFRVVAETDHSSSEPSMAALLHRKPVPRFPTQEPCIRDLSPNIVLLSWQPATVPSGGVDVSYRVEIQTPPGISPWSTLYATHPTPSVRLADLRPDLDYLVRVRATTLDGYVSEPTLPVYIPRRAVPPRMTTEEPYAVEITSDSVKLQWRSADLPSHITDYAPVTYHLEAIELPAGDWMTVARGIPHTDFKVTGLNPLKDYSFRVRAANSYGTSDPTRSTTVKTRSVAPIMPSEQPLLYDIGTGSVRLTWRPAHMPSHVTSSASITYTIYVQEEPFKTWRPLVRRIPHTSYSLSGLKADMAYNFRIEAENEYGTSQPTEAVLLPRISDIKRPISMPEVSDFDENLTFVKLQWKPSSRAGSPFGTSPRKYMIETWEPIKREWRTHARGIADTSYRLRDLPKMYEPIFRVRMETETTELSEPSLPVSLGKFYKYRVPVYRPQLFELDTDTVRLSWEAAHVPDASSKRIRYIVEQREVPETRWTTLASDLLETSYKVKGLRSKSDYEFRVKVVIDGTQSEPSFPVALYRRPVIPSIRLEAPEVTEVDDTSVGLRWRKVDIPAFSNSDEPLTFIIERQELPSYEWQTVASDVQDSTYKVSDLKPYQDYNFRVRGLYPSGYTDPSPYVPVYRRPSESKLGIFGVESSTLANKYASAKTVSSQNVPSFTPRTSPPVDYSAVHRSAINARMSRLAKIYDLSEATFAGGEASFKSAQPIKPIFRREDAYVYKRQKSPTPVRMPSMPSIRASPAPETRRVKLDENYDLYKWYKRTRRHSDAGLEELRKSRERRLEDDLRLEERKFELMIESQRRARNRQRKAEPSKVVSFEKIRPSSTTDKYASVADRLEDIKCPYIAEHWSFPRRHSVSLDPEDLERLKQARAIGEIKNRKMTAKAKRFMSKTDDDIYVSRRSRGDHIFLVQDEVDIRHTRPATSSSYDPGYFVLSKFSLSVSGTKKRRAVSPPPRPTYEERVRYPSYEPTTRSRSHEQSHTSFKSDYERSRSMSVTKSQDIAEWAALSQSISRQLDKANSQADRARSEARRSASRAGSVYSSAAGTYVKPRSNSMQVPQHERAHFNRLVESSKSLVSRLQERDYSRSSSVTAETIKARSMSVADVKKDPRYSFTPRASVSTISGSSTPLRHMTPAPDVRSDPRYSSHSRSSVSVLSSAEKRGSFDVRADPRFSEGRRATISATTNVDLKYKLDTLHAQLQPSKPKKKVKKVMKFKSSRGEGFVTQ